jgi:DNA-binding MarR family transcriptional regulator
MPPKSQPVRARKASAEASIQMPSLGRTLDFMRLLWAVDHGLQSTSKRMERSLGVTGSQRLVLRVVGRIPGISAGMLASVLHLDPGTLSGVLARLERNGLLARGTDPADGRRAVLVLTPRGLALGKNVSGTVEAAVSGAMASLGRKEIASAERVLARIAEALAPAPPEAKDQATAPRPSAARRRKPRG